MTSEQEPQGWRTSREGRDGHRAPSARETPWVREGTPPEATPVPPSQPQKPRPFPRGKRGVEAEAPCRETSCSKIERQTSRRAASKPTQRGKPPRHRAGERQHPSGRRSRPNPRTGAKRQQGEKKRGQAPHLRRLEYHKTGPARSEDSNVEPTTLQSRTDYQRKAQSHSKAKPDCSKSPTVAIPSIEIRSKIQTR